MFELGVCQADKFRSFFKVLSYALLIFTQKIFSSAENVGLIIPSIERLKFIMTNMNESGDFPIFL